MVYLVGAGPGDPGLITVKALEILKKADVLMFDRLADSSFLCEAPPDCIMIDVGKSVGNHARTQDETTELLVEYGRKDLEVVRLKGGDPFLFGRGGEEAERLSQEGIPFVIVPGISALNAATAYAGIPITHRNVASSVGVATGHAADGKKTDPVRWRELAKGVDTIVVFMGVGAMDNITKELQAGGLAGDTPAALIERGTSPMQRTITGTLSTIVDVAAKAEVKPPALLVVGKTIELKDTLSWYTPGPLKGMRIGITRPFVQSKAFTVRLRDLGAQPTLMPTIKTVDTIDTPEVESVMNNIFSFDYIVFSSKNGVDSFFRALKASGGDTRTLAGIDIAAIGPITAQSLLEYGVTADVTAEKYIAEGLAESLCKDPVKGLKFLIVRSDIGRTTLRDELQKAGAEIEHAAFYSTINEGLTPHIASVLKSGALDMITFTSSSTVTSLFEQVDPKEIPDTVKIASIGPQTTKTLESYGKTPDVEAAEYTTEGLANAILEKYGEK